MILSLHDTGIRWYHIVIVWYWNPLVVDGMWKRLDCVMLVWCLLQFVVATIIVWLLLLCDMTRVHYSMQWLYDAATWFSHTVSHRINYNHTVFVCWPEKNWCIDRACFLPRFFFPFLFCHRQVSFRAAVWYDIILLYIFVIDLSGDRVIMAVEWLDGCGSWLAALLFSNIHFSLAVWYLAPYCTLGWGCEEGFVKVCACVCA